MRKSRKKSKSSKSPSNSGTGEFHTQQPVVKEDNPMKIDLILEVIFGFCPASTLRSCRLVCKQWRDVSLNAWRRSAILRIGFEAKCLDLDEFLQLIPLDKPTTEGGDGKDDTPLQLKKRPFKRYSVKLMGLGPLNKGVAEAISKAGARHVKILWDSRSFNGLHDYLQSLLEANSMESLEMVYRSLEEPLLESQKLLNCGTLKRLNLCERISSESRFTVPPTKNNVSGYLLKSFPHLEALSTEFDLSGCELRRETSRLFVDRLYRARQGIVTLMERLRRLGKETALSLKELDMMEIYGKGVLREDEYEHRSIIRTLAECEFPLEKLSFQIVWNGEGVIPILPLLNSCKDTLLYFKTSISFDDSHFSNSGQCRFDSRTGKSFAYYVEPVLGEKVSMKKLEELRIVNGVEWAMFFLAHLELPKLKKVIVEHAVDRNPFYDSHYHLMSVFPFSDVSDWEVFESLETFELHDNPYFLKRDYIKRLAWMMPNLTHLTIALKKSTLVLICQHFKGLKTLNILAAENKVYWDIDDESLTGLSSQQLEYSTIARRGYGFRVPNLTDLKCLSDFRIDCKNYLRENVLDITEYSVIYGFLQLPKLYNLSVAIKDLSEQTKEKLLSHVKGNVVLQ